AVDRMAWLTESPAVWAWLAKRWLRNANRPTETLYREYELLLALIWRAAARLAAALRAMGVFRTARPVNRPSRSPSGIAKTNLPRNGRKDVFMPALIQKFLRRTKTMVSLGWRTLRWPLRHRRLPGRHEFRAFYHMAASLLPARFRPATPAQSAAPLPPAVAP